MRSWWGFLSQKSSLRGDCKLMSTALLYVCMSVRVCMCVYVFMCVCAHSLLSLLLLSPEWARRPDTDGIPAGCVLGPPWKSQRHSDRRSICLRHQTHPQFFHPASADWYQKQEDGRDVSKNQRNVLQQVKKSAGSICQGDCQGTWSFLKKWRLLVHWFRFYIFTCPYDFQIKMLFEGEKHFQSAVTITNKRENSADEASLSKPHCKQEN